MVAGGRLERREARREGEVQQGRRRQAEQAVVRRGEDVGELGPALRRVQVGVGAAAAAAGTAGREGEQAAGLLDLGRVGVPVGDEVLLGVGDGLEELGLGLGADELNVLLEAEEELELALFAPPLAVAMIFWGDVGMRNKPPSF